MTESMGVLPSAARERIARQLDSRTAGSLFSAPAAAAARSAGLVPVGEVFGCLVMNLGWAGTGCGGLYAVTSPVRVDDGSRVSGLGFGPYAKAYETAWHGALNRLRAEAGALGAEGVVGVTISRSRLDGNAWEFAAVGTAVRSVDHSLVARPPAGEIWTAGLDAEDCAAAIQSGYVPRELALGLAIATKHEDRRLKQQRSSWSNTEVDGLTQLLNAARNGARERLQARAHHFSGADLAITHTRVTEFESTCRDGLDLHAEAAFIGTVLTPGPRAQSRSASRLVDADVLSVLPLTDAT